MKNLITNNWNGTDEVGGKAKNLFRLQENGFNIPKFAVIPSAILMGQIDAKSEVEVLKEQVKNAIIPKRVFVEINDFFGDEINSCTFSVRSSSAVEDGSKFSFAGQFKSFLNVTPKELGKHIKLVWESTVSDEVLQYQKHNGLEVNANISVIIQKMVNADSSGVAFGLNPTNGDKSTKIISSVYGLGEGLVSGELNADLFEVKNSIVSETIVPKTHQFSFDQEEYGIVKTAVPTEEQNKPSLSKEHILQLEKNLEQLENLFGSPQDIEFAVQNDTLYLLQSRAITAAGISNEGEYTLWDNSNIIESYPGITTPLTYSFINKMYESVYRQFVGIMGVQKAEIEEHREVFANTLGLIRGRVYYNLLSWYKMLAMAPGYSINAEFMENMMGVKERFELDGKYQMSKGLAWFRIVQMIFRMIRLHFQLPKERKKFITQLNGIIKKYDQLDYNSMSPKEIIEHYNTFESTTLLQWKAPLINDFFAMIWFGLLQKQTEKYCPDSPNIHNDLLCGSQDIISTEPIRLGMKIAKSIDENSSAKQLFLEKDADYIWKKLDESSFAQIKQEIDEYLDKFGNRCVGELKLETISYSQEPELFIRILQSYAKEKLFEKKTTNSIENNIRKEAEQKMNAVFKRKPIRKRLFRYILKKARDMVSNRENLRYERTRGFGIVRTMFSALGKQLKIQDQLNDPRDIFYMELNELLSLSKTSVSQELLHSIEKRKTEFKEYESQQIPEERFFTYGNNFSDEYIYSKEKVQAIDGDLSGIGCCPGIVKSKVRVVLNPNEINSMENEILVTSSTDPGWVTLFPSSAGIIVERGSLLSHSAIVSREMGIPCIVGVTGLLRTLKTGDEIIMDGSTGKIEIIGHE